MNHDNINTAYAFFEIDGNVSSCIDLSQISFEYGHDWGWKSLGH